MESDLIVRQKREFGKLITDPFKFIFRNIKEISLILSLYVMVPFIVAFVMYSSVLTNITTIEFNNASIIKLVVMILFVLVGYVNLILAAYCIFKDADENGSEHIAFEKVNILFKSLFIRHLAYFVSLFLLTIFAFVICGLSAIISPILSVIVIFFVGLTYLFYVYPIIAYGYFHYLEDRLIRISTALERGKNDVDENWGGSIGIIIVSGIVTNYMQYAIIIPYGLIVYMMGTAVNVDGENLITTIATYVQNSILGIGLCYLSLFSIAALLLKFYDIQEQKHGTNLLSKIQAIGQQEESYFDNSGEY